MLIDFGLGQKIGTPLEFMSFASSYRSFEELSGLCTKQNRSTDCGELDMENEDYRKWMWVSDEYSLWVMLVNHYCPFTVPVYRGGGPFSGSFPDLWKKFTEPDEKWWSYWYPDFETQAPFLTDEVIETCLSKRRYKGEYWGPILRDVLAPMLTQRPEDRLTAKQALEYFKSRFPRIPSSSRNKQNQPRK